MKIRRLQLLLVCAVALTVASTGCKKKKEAAESRIQPAGLPGSVPSVVSSIPDPVATVNGVPIRGADLEAAISAALRDAAKRGTVLTEQQRAQIPGVLLRNLVVKELTYQVGAKEGLTPPDEVVSNEVARIQARFKSPEDFQNVLQRYGVDLDGFSEIVKKDLTSKALIEKHIRLEEPTTDEEARKYYDEHPEEFDAPERAKVYQIVIRFPEDADEATIEAARNRILDIKKRIEDGEDFEKVASEVSEDPASAQRGGLVGILGRGRLPEEVDKAVFEGPLNTVSDPVRLPQAWAIVKTTERKPAGHLAYEEGSEQIKQALDRRKRDQKMAEYIQQLLREADIKVNIPAGESAVAPEGAAPADAAVADPSPIPVPATEEPETP